MDETNPHKLIIRSDMERIVEGIVYAPYQVDTWKTMMLPEDIVKMASDFSIQRMDKKVDHEHDEVDSGCKVLRHWIAGSEDPDGYPEGAWVARTKILNDTMWDMVLRGEINGYSIHCMAAHVPFSGIVNVVKRAEGDVEPSSNNILLPTHSHALILCFTDGGVAIPTKTSEVLGHWHSVISPSTTGTTFDHSHPIKIGES